MKGIVWGLALLASLSIAGSILAGESKHKEPLNKYQALCKASGYQAGSPENQVCASLLEEYAPFASEDRNSGPFQPVVRSVSSKFEDVKITCSLTRSREQLVTCSRSVLVPLK